MTEISLNGARRDRAAGALLAQACGDALGVPYEFKPPMPRDERAEMKGSGVFGPGEWSDDTEMALCIARALARASRGQRCDVRARRRTLPRVDVLRQGHRHTDLRRHSAKRTMEQGAPPSAAGRRHVATAKSGCGRRARAGPATAPSCARASWPSPTSAIVTSTAEVVRRVAALTHVDEDVEDSCVLWTEAVRRAVAEDWGTNEGFTQDFMLAGLDLIPVGRRAKWEAIVRESTGAEPWSFGSNGWTVKTFKVAWAAITSTPVPPLDPAAGSFPCQHLEHALDAAVHAGWDTDTVAAVAGQLLGARWGASAVPAKWMRRVCGRGPSEDGVGYAQWRTRDLVRVGLTVALSGVGKAVGPDDWPRARRVDNPGATTPLRGARAPGRRRRVHRRRDESRARLRRGGVGLPCRHRRADPRGHGRGRPGRAHAGGRPARARRTRNLHFSLDDGARATCQMRHEGRRVLVHCVNDREPLAVARGPLRGPPRALGGRGPGRSPRGAGGLARLRLRTDSIALGGLSATLVRTVWVATGVRTSRGTQARYEEFHPCR